jgi:hypothetical protein
MSGVADDLADFYATRFSEDERLRATPAGRLELARTRELLDRYVRVPGVVADVGGGTGVHARRLAEHGHRVELLDVVPEHVEQASRLPGVGARLADARDATSTGSRSSAWRARCGRRSMPTAWTGWGSCSRRRCGVRGCSSGRRP